MAEVGRPTEKTPEVIRKIEEAAAMDCSMEEIAFFANIHRATLYRWIKEDKELKDRIEGLKQTPFLKARQTILKSISENPQYAFEYMKRKKKDEFSDRQELTGKDGGELKINIIDYGKGDNNTI
jgi:predicted DNA-binding protein YlxM (UPF0122 family)